MPDVLILSRLQFAMTIMFHYIFPPITIGLGLILVAMEGTFLWTRDRLYEDMARFWTKIFAVNFAMGVATGIVMEFQFGTNWAAYSRFVGDIFGSALAAEGIFAFFLESGFLAVLVFGWDKVSPRMHFFSTIMVALGSMFSAIWIVVANSWQQTPSGYLIVPFGTGFRAEITDFWSMVFNPSSVIRLTHVLIGAYILGAFFVLSVSAFYILKGRYTELARKSFGLVLGLAFAASLAAAVTGHRHAQVVAATQPAKLAAFEGHFETGQGGTRLYMFGIPDVANRRVRGGVFVPGLLSFLVHGDFVTPVPGLDKIPDGDRPPVAPCFYSFHLMVMLGFAFIGLTGYATFLRLRGRLFENRWLLWLFVFAVVGPVIANQVGWVAAEMGRQPWVVYGLLRTSDGLSKVLQGSDVAASLLMFGGIYFLLFLVWIYVLDAKIRQGPEETTRPTHVGPRQLADAASGLAGHEESLTEGRQE